MNKKAVVTMQFLIIMLVSVLGFFVIFTFISSTGDTITNEIEEQQCKTYLEARSSTIGKAADFFLGLSNTCKTGNMQSDLEEKEEVFELIAKRSRSCWERYGSGELDFMSNYNTNGEYCFPCTQIVFEEGDFEYDYGEFIEWVQENRPENVEKTYGELVNFEYYDPTTEEFENISSSFRELEEELQNYQREEEDTTLVELSLHLNDYRTKLLDMKNKKIISGEPQYVVFKYSRLNNTLSQTLTNTIESAGIATGAGYVAGTVIRGVLSGGVGAVYSVVNLANKAEKATRLQKILDKSLSAMQTIRQAKKSTKLIAAGTGAVSGGFTGANFNSNYNQYIEVIGQEEFYRTCGVVPNIEE